MPTLSHLEKVNRATTFLFVPGDRPGRFAKAAASGADVIIIDLEDAVAKDAKQQALENTITWLKEMTTNTALVRINAGEYRTELEALRAAAPVGLLGVVLPKSENQKQLETVASALPAGSAIIALIETAAGIENAGSIAASNGVTRIAFGAVDFASDTGSTHESVFDYARAKIVVASRAAGLTSPLDSPCVTLGDETVIADETVRAKEFGFGGKLCIHPAQIEVVQKAFQPTAAEIEWAKLVAEAPDGAISIGGQMIDKPIVERAKTLLARVRETEA